jgi:predicted nucleic acid-binding protein
VTAPTLYLLDTSAWIPLLRRSPREVRLANRAGLLIQSDQVAATGPVRLEVLRGARDEAHLAQLRDLLASLQQLPTTEETWDDAAVLGVRLRRAGLVTQFSDLLIAAVAIRAGATVLHRDRDFDLMAQHAPLRVESYVS